MSIASSAFTIHSFICTVDPQLSGPQLSGILGYPASISAHSILTPMLRTRSKVAVLDRWNTQRCQNFERPKPEEAKIRRLFASMMDNMTGKETAVLIMIHYRPYLHDDSHIRLFHLSGHGLVLL